ncbi:hypothetical protein V2J09_022516, partial [Rumex salicifolius]
GLRELQSDQQFRKRQNYHHHQQHHRRCRRRRRFIAEMTNMMYVRAEPSAELNKNTEWFSYPGVWTTYILLLFVPWLLLVSLLGCTPGIAWTVVHLLHFFVTYHCFHWKKGTPFADDQGMYNRLTWWEQIDDGKQLTRNRKFLTVVPVFGSLPYNKLSKPDAHLQHTGTCCARCCQDSPHAQGSHIRDQWRSVVETIIQMHLQFSKTQKGI